MIGWIKPVVEIKATFTDDLVVILNCSFNDIKELIKTFTVVFRADWTLESVDNTEYIRVIKLTTGPDTSEYTITFDQPFYEGGETAITVDDPDTQIVLGANE